MRPRKSSLLLLALFCALLTALAQLPASAGYEFPICTAPGAQWYPAISGSVVVWEDSRNYATTDYDIYGYDLSTGREFAICTAPDTQWYPAIYGNIVVWQDLRNDTGDWSNVDIYGKDLATGREFSICTAPGSQGLPDISANIVVWGDGRNDAPDSSKFDIYGKDLATGRELPICTAPEHQWGPAISGNIVVWEDSRNDPSYPYEVNRDIYGKDLSTGREFPICTAPGYQIFPAICGNIVVWEDRRNGETIGSDIYGYDLTTRREFPICTAPGNQGFPRISGNIVVWTDGRDLETNGYDIYGYDLSTGREFPICTAPGSQGGAAISGNIVSWVDYGNTDDRDYDIWGCRLDGYGGSPTTLPDQPWLPDWPVEGPVYHYPTQLHAHYRHEVSRWWDMTPNQLAELYRYDHGYSFTAATEHYPQYSWDGGFWDTTGAEAVGRIVDSFEDTGAKHILGIGFDHTRMDLGLAGSQSHEVERVRNIQRSGGGIAIAAHPNDSKYKWEDWVLQNCASQARLAGIEVFNAGVWLTPGGWWYSDATWMWDSLLERGHVVWGTAGDDFTNPWPQEDDACVVIVSPSSSLSTYGAMSALRRGAFYSCKGGWRGGVGAPTISAWWAEPSGEDVIVHLVTPQPYSKVEFVANGGTHPAVLQQRPDGRYEARYTMQVDGYVRAAVSTGGAFPAISWTQPIFIGPQGTQTFMWAPQAASTRAAEPIVIDFDQAHLEISQPQSNLAGTVYAYLLPPSDRPPSSPPLGYIGSCYRFLPGAALDGTNTLRLGYDPQEVTLVPEAMLAVYWFDPDQEAWVELPSTVDESAHTVTAPIAALGTFAVSAAMPEETNAPGVFILSPAGGSALSGTQTITADAWDDNGVASVQFFLGNLPLGTDVAGGDGWTADLDCSRHPPGSYIIAAVARDVCGNEGRTEIQVILEGGAPAPTLTITSPAAEAAVAGTLHAEGAWWDDEAPLKVIAMLGEVPLGLPALDAGGTWSLTASIVGVPAGSYPLTVAGEDAAGNPISATVQVIVVAPGTLTGRVRALETPVNLPGAAVDARMGGVLRGSATTNVNGLYSITNLPPGAYSVTARKQGYVSKTKTGITVAAGQATALDFGLHLSGRLTGKVTDLGTGSGLAGAAVTASLGGVVKASATTAANGIYVIDRDLPAGTYVVTAGKVGYVPRAKGSITVTGGQTTYVHFWLDAQCLNGFVAVAGPTSTRIAGAGISVSLGGVLKGTAITDANGIYMIGAHQIGLTASGSYVVTAAKAGFVHQGKSVTLTPGVLAHLNLSLPVSGRLRGWVKDKGTSAYIVGSTVKAYQGGILRATATTNANGNYNIDRDLPAGTYSVKASKTGYSPLTKTSIKVTAGATTYVYFSLPPGAELRARIQGPSDGKLAASIQLKFYAPGGSGTPLHSQTVSLNSYGQGFAGLNLPAGTYDVWGKVATHLAKRIAGWSYQPGTGAMLDFGTLLAGDLINDNVVNQADKDYMLSKWFSSDPIADINRDGPVNTADLSILMANWGKTGDS